MKKRPLLKDHLITFFSFSDKEKAYIFDIVSGCIVMEINKKQQYVLELATGRRTIGEIASVDKDILNFFQILYNIGLIEWADNG